MSKKHIQPQNRSANKNEEQKTEKEAAENEISLEEQRATGRGGHEANTEEDMKVGPEGAEKHIQKTVQRHIEQMRRRQKRPESECGGKST